MPRPPRRDEKRDQEQEAAVETAALFEALTAGLPVDDADLDSEQRARRLLAHLLEFHRREDKSMSWEYFHRCGFTENEHVESRATLGALTYAGEAGQVKRSVIHRYRFPEQPHELEVGDSPKNPATCRCPAGPARGGVFLDQTWRMHPDICAFTTEQFYEGRLRPRAELSRQTVVGPGPLAGHGLRFVPVEHAGNTNASAEEAECVARLIRELLDAGAAWVDRQGVQRRLTLDDVLVVAPYNAHVAILRATLPTGARVGTVDKFQGREAPIVIYSMATSTADEAPRGMEFLYSLHRLRLTGQPQADKWTQPPRGNYLAR